MKLMPQLTHLGAQQNNPKIQGQKGKKKERKNRKGSTGPNELDPNQNLGKFSARNLIRKLLGPTSL